MKTLWQYKWTIAMLPVAALGVCMYSYYIGFMGVEIFSKDIREVIMSPGWFFILALPEDVNGLGFILDYANIAFIEAVFLYVTCRTLLDLRTGCGGMNLGKKDIFYAPYFALIWFPIKAGIILMMNYTI